ncbi:DUF4132 domain-containing protein [Rhodocytophaga rosea]|uniref:DUF4132 domain-containing protein n=1 Tax=Rhodocytophaga rosea TaxID=2704465 RepID=A0A6C0GK35_9BACT|nr:DUF4132 domain-containing protein [Rhodocytophaga rosea]QHT68043.1 DUF4132 domain-containing protein [Rhodocytophaga rosea]
MKILYLIVFNYLLDTLTQEAIGDKQGYYTVKLSDLPTYLIIKQKDSAFKAALIDYLIHKILFYDETIRNRHNASLSLGDIYRLREVHDKLLNILMRSTIDFSEDDLIHILELYLKANSTEFIRGFLQFPVLLTLNQVQKYILKHTLSPRLAGYLKVYLKRTEEEVSYYKAENTKVKLKILEITASFNPDQPTNIRPIFLDDKDVFGQFMNTFTQSQPIERQALYYSLVGHFKKASGGKPSQKYLHESEKIIQQIGLELFSATSKEWLLFLKTIDVQLQTHTSNYGGREYTYSSYFYLQEANQTFIKGWLWSLKPCTNKEMLQEVAGYAEKCFQKIPSKGPLAAGIGNACIYLLGNVGLLGVSHLSRLKLKIRQSNTQQLIETYIEQASKDLGVSTGEIEDMAIQEYGLKDGQLTYCFADYKAVLNITGIGKTELNWYKSDSTLLKSEPSFIKKNHNLELKEIKNTASQIQKTLSAQRDRLDRSFVANRSWTYKKFSAYYFHHGLMSFLTKQLIWTFQKGNHKADAFFLAGTWRDVYEKEVDWIGEDTQVQLWHPIEKPIEEVLAWRSFLNQYTIKQPLKQAYREVYLLTEAEVATRTYSNRMAAHILKQHQFNSLAKLRGWKYSLLGAYDDGRDNEIAQINLPEYKLQAQFWVNEVNADEAWNDTGIWNYVATDQVRFMRMEGNEVINLMDVPALVLSEVMRDVDLFVGVASVGNDPTWQDSGGLPTYRDYWHRYSFGELSEVAKTRKAVLERLIPKLKIAKVCQIKDKFLIVKGELRTYKIHLGSGNILMEPNDQYLCIVPDRKMSTSADNIFLPFEGDAVLSIIISKAFLLADDTKIIDPTITRQIR